MLGLIPTVALGGAAIGAIGSNLGALGSGIGSATQNLVSVGVLGKTAGVAKSMFKW